MFTIYFPNLKLPNNFINNHSWNKFQRNFLQSYRILQIIITYYKISESSIFFITFYLGFIAARIAKSALKFRERMRECLQSRTHDYEIEELEDDQRLVSRATSVFATGLDVLIVFPSPSFSTHPHGSFQVSPSTPFSLCYRARWKRYTVSRVYSEVNIQRVPTEDKGTGFAVNHEIEMTTFLTLSK